MKGLTPRQLEIYTFIERFKEERGYAPSLREIGVAMNIPSVSAVHKHIETLVSKGALQKLRYRSRSLEEATKQEKKRENEEIHLLNLIGTLSSNLPIEMSPRPQEIAVPKFFVFEPSSTYVFRIRGDGFQEEGIHQGDLLLVEARPYADPGETVVVEVEKNIFYIRKYLSEDGLIRLTSQNVEAPPLLFRESEVTIHGIVTGLIRLY